LDAENRKARNLRQFFDRCIFRMEEDAAMVETNITLDADERDCLIQVLENSLKNHRVEEHRTRAPTYREQILQEEKLLEQLLTKLGHSPK
jgi:hypothetical protein